MWIMGLVTEVVADPLSQIPWPAQLSLIGSLIVAIVFILRWQNQQVQKGNLIPKVEHDRALAQKDTEYTRMEKLLTDQIGALTGRGDEWKAAHGVSEAAREVERETTKAAVQSNRLMDAFMDRFTQEVDPRMGGVNPAEAPAALGQNGVKEATP